MTIAELARPFGCFAVAVFACIAAMGDDLVPTGGELTYAGNVANLVENSIREGDLPGAVVVIADSKQVIFAQAYGDKRLEPTEAAMTLDTLFDLASLTKPISTATSVMKLVESGAVDLDERVSHYLPEFESNGKDQITVRDLLLHVGGLIPDNHLRDYNEGPELAWQRICDLKLIAPIGEKFAYTDVGFIVLGKLVERVSGKPLDVFAKEQIFVPAGMRETGYKPGPKLRDRAAPTEQRDGKWMVGEVHDPRAYRLDGVAGHAGLFSTPSDLVRYGQAMLASVHSTPKAMFTSETFATMTKPHKVPRGTRALGWDHRSPYSRNRGESLSDHAFGHGGFTGTVMWIDPGKDLIFVFLSNRLHPDGKGSVNTLAGKIITLVGDQVPEVAQGDTKPKE